MEGVFLARVPVVALVAFVTEIVPLLFGKRRDVNFVVVGFVGFVVEELGQ